MGGGDYLNALIEPILNNGFDWLLDPAKRTHFVFLFSSLIIAAVWAGYRWTERKRYLLELGQKSYWFNASTYQDYFLIFFNRGLFFVLGIPWLILTLDVSLLTLDFWRLFGDVSSTPVTGNWVIGLYTLVVFLLDDVSRYALHRIMHKYDFLWRIHQVHHSASRLTPFTTLRIHPLESIFYSIRSSLVHGICIGSGFFFLGYQPDSWQLWGATIWVLVFNFLGANLRHSEIPLNYGWLEKLFISPAMHQAHHGLRSMQTNYGSVLSIWDKLGGSWRSGELEYQLPKEAQPLSKQLLLLHIQWK